MKKIQFWTVLFTLGSMMFSFLAFPVYAGNSTVVITAKGTDGKKISSLEISCTKTKKSSGGGLPPAPQWSYLKTNSQGVATWSIAADSNYTYDCVSRTATSPDGCYYALGATSPRNFSLSSGQSKAVTISLKPQACKAKTTTSTKTTDPASAISSATLPATFTQEGSTTSSFKGLSTSSAKSFKNLTLDIKNVGKIVWSEAVDLSASDLKEKFAKLDQYVRITNGKIAIDFTALPQLKKKATVTLNVNLVDAPIVIEKTTAEAGTGHKDTYDAEKKTLSIVVTDWAESYQIDPGLQLEAPPTTSTQTAIAFLGKVNNKDVNVYYTVNDPENKNKISVPVTDGTFSQTFVGKPGKLRVSVLAVAAGSENDILATKDFEVTIEEPKLNWWQQFTNWLRGLWS